MIQSLLIANRGEIACRIIRTARAIGIRTVAVYSDADAKALHVRQADEAVHIGPSPARESYLVGEMIIAAALATKAEAIHPGYGFLSENADFAQAVIDAGLVWVGPRPASITAMGLKDAAKTLMAAAGVPVTPGYMGANQDPAFLAARHRLDEHGIANFGGGKGMRKVEAAAEFADALASCQREATASFGNAHVLIEKYIQRPRHIEVQVFGDTFGQIVHLFERDCSLQRRHQKVIEEAPAPGVTPYTRELICGAAVRAAKAVNYVGAGTIEFIADSSKGFIDPDLVWFMEMNTRLQVEHPVTEEITGVDLVEWQLRIASGEPLPKRQDELSIDGWAMEARLYAEDPLKGFLPSTGTLDYFELDGSVRIDTGVQQGSAVTPFYDPMIAKMIAHDTDREGAIQSLAWALNDSKIWPVKNNAAFLINALEHPDFASGNVDTGLLARDLDSLLPDEAPDHDDLEQAAETFTRQPMAGFRLNRSRNRRVVLSVDGVATEVDAPILDYVDQKPLDAGSTPPEGWFLSGNGQTWRVEPFRSSGGGHSQANDGTILSPMPGRIIAVEVAAGQTVTKGQKLLTLEAMKMEHSLTAPFDGVVAELNAVVGAQVQVEAVLVRVEVA